MYADVQRRDRVAKMKFRLVFSLSLCFSSPPRFLPFFIASHRVVLIAPRPISTAGLLSAKRERERISRFNETSPYLLSAPLDIASLLTSIVKGFEDRRKVRVKWNGRIERDIRLIVDRSRRERGREGDYERARWRITCAVIS